MSHLPLDARAILEYLNELGYRNISGEQLKEFIKDLRKLIKYEEKLGIRYRDPKNLQELYRKTTASFRAKIDDRLDLITDVSALRLRPSSRCSGTRFTDIATGYATHTSSLISSDTFIPNSYIDGNVQTHLSNEDPKGSKQQKTDAMYRNSSANNIRSSGSLQIRHASSNDKQNQQDAPEEGKKMNRKIDANKQVAKIMERERRRKRAYSSDPVARSRDVDRNAEHINRTSHNGIVGHRLSRESITSIDRDEVVGYRNGKERNMCVNRDEVFVQRGEKERIANTDQGRVEGHRRSRERNSSTDRVRVMGHQRSRERISSKDRDRVMEHRRSREHINSTERDAVVGQRGNKERINSTEHDRVAGRRYSKERISAKNHGRAIGRQRSSERIDTVHHGRVSERKTSGERKYSAERETNIRRARSGERNHAIGRSGIVTRERSGERFRTESHGTVLGRGQSGGRAHSAERNQITGRGRNVVKGRTLDSGQLAEFGSSSERSYGTTYRRPHIKISKTESVATQSTLISRRFPEIRTKKQMNTDPVALYQYYKAEWEHFREQIPEDNKRSLERWNVRRLHLDPH